MGVARAVVVLAGAVACGDNTVPEARVVGQMWIDDNGNGVFDADEAPLVGVTVFINLDNDPTINYGDATTRTTETGSFELSVPGPGTYTVRPLLPFGTRLSVMSKPQRRTASIIGGKDTAAGEFAFMVAVAFRFEDFVYPFCGGVLITDRHVVTAAHCSAGSNPGEVAVIAGALDPFLDGQALAVERITIHPEYNFNATHGNDIAVWTLADPVPLEAMGLTTVEMLSAATREEPGTLATAIGWGISDRSSQLLQQVHLPLVSSDDCAAAYPEAKNIDTQICAGAPEGGVDSCQGDSGGPLLVRDDARQVWLHAGITSYGDGCALRDTPGVYARVSALSEWATSNAIEPDAAQVVTVQQDVTGESTGTVDFPTRSTTRPQIGAIAPRWQPTGTTLPGNVAADTPFTVRWTILGDVPTLTGFTCAFNSDLAGAATPQNVACGLGANQVALPGFATGIFATELTVTRTDATFSRRVNVVSGFPAVVNRSGALSTSDPFDPDFGGSSFYIDYYDVTGLSGTRAFAVDASSSAFSVWLALYDLDQRDFVNGGGILAFGTTVGIRERILVIPEVGRRYLIGVSSFDTNAVGSYTVSILNDGTLTPR